MNKKMLAACDIIRKNGFSPILLYTAEGRIDIVLFINTEQNIVYGIIYDTTNSEKPYFLGHLFNSLTGIELGLYTGAKSITNDTVKAWLSYGKECYEYDLNIGIGTVEPKEALAQYINKSHYNTEEYEEFLNINEEYKKKGDKHGMDYNRNISI